jgi:hypothetical protein
MLELIIINIIILITTSVAIIFSLLIYKLQSGLKVVLTALSIGLVSLILFYNYLCSSTLIFNNSCSILLALVIFIFILFISKFLVYSKVKKIHINNREKRVKKLKKQTKVKATWIETKNLIFLYAKRSNKKDESKSITLFQTFIKIIRAITSLDYFISDISKDCIEGNIEDSYEAKAELIQYFNWLNLSIVLGFAIFIILIFDFSLWNNEIPTKVSITIMVYLFIRSISRSLEIIYAFFGDVATRTGKDKSTNLDRYDRLSLAVTSYIEIIISYSLFYYLWAFIFINDYEFILFDKLIKSIGIMTFSDIFLYNRSTENIKIFLFNTAVTLQIITSIVLVVFAVASYLSDN